MEDVFLWLDNFSAQGKNWWIYTALVAEVNRRCGNMETITIKYFEPGHTFMSADSFHHQVEMAIKRKRRLDNFMDFVVAVKSKGEALVLNYKDFLTIPREVSQGDFAKKKPKLEDVRFVKFTRGSYEMFWKTGYSQVEFNSAQFLQRKIQKSLVLKSFESFPSKQTPRGANSAKISKIVEKLCPHMDLMKRKF